MRPLRALHPTTCHTVRQEAPPARQQQQYLYVMDDYNSDDLVFSDREESPSRSRIGERSVRLIFENAAADRVATKKLVRQLQFTDGGISPGIRMNQSLWVKRLDSMRTAWGQKTNEP